MNSLLVMVLIQLLSSPAQNPPSASLQTRLMMNNVTGFCKKLGIQYDRKGAQIQQVSPRLPNHWALIAKNYFIGFDSIRGRVEMLDDKGYATSRRLLPREGRPLRRSDEEWYRAGSKIIDAAWPGTVVNPKGCEHNEDRDMFASDARTVRLFYRVQQPKAAKGDFIVVIFDMDSGRLMTIQYIQADLGIGRSDTGFPSYVYRLIIGIRANASGFDTCTAKADAGIGLFTTV